MRWHHDDGGRAAAGWIGHAGDCTVRAVAIALQRDYQLVYDELNLEAKRERPRKGRTRSSARNGVHRRTTRRYLEAFGWNRVPTMRIGSGCLVHLREDELPTGRLIVSLSRHLAAVIDGVVFDTHDPTREGTRCVYGYWIRPRPDPNRSHVLGSYD